MAQVFNRYDAQLQRCLKIALKFDLDGVSFAPEQIYSQFYSDKSEDAAKKAFERDRKLLELIGITINYDVLTNTYSQNLDALKTAPLTLTKDESAALGVALHAMVSEPSFPLPLALQSGLNKMAKRIQDDTDEYAISAHMTLDKNADEQQRLLEALIGALKTRRMVAFRYTNAQGEISQRKVAPFGLNQYKGQWYLIGLDADGCLDIRTFSVANIEQLEIASSEFEFPADFVLGDYCTPPYLWGSGEKTALELVIPARSAHRAASIMAGIGACSPQDDGSLLWEMSYRDLDKLCEFVVAERLSFGPHADKERAYFVDVYLERVVSAHV